MPSTFFNLRGRYPLHLTHPYLFRSSGQPYNSSCNANTFSMANGRSYLEHMSLWWGGGVSPHQPNTTGHQTQYSAVPTFCEAAVLTTEPPCGFGRWSLRHNDYVEQRVAMSPQFCGEPYVLLLLLLLLFHLLLLCFMNNRQDVWWWLTLMETDRLLLMLAFWSQPCFMMPPLWEHSDAESWADTNTNAGNQSGHTLSCRLIQVNGHSSPCACRPYTVSTASCFLNI